VKKEKGEEGESWRRKGEMFFEVFVFTKFHY
jgi:hypothetical protein